MNLHPDPAQMVAAAKGAAVAPPTFVRLEFVTLPVVWPVTVAPHAANT